MSFAARHRRRRGDVPAAWTDEQRAVYEAYLTRRGGGERRRVKILWWTEADTGGPDVMGLVSSIWSGRRRGAGPGRVLVALYHAGAPVGDPPELVVPVDATTLTEPSGRALATAIGRCEPGGALVIETSRGPLLPAAPPAPPDEASPPWSEVDAPG
ncbi:MAG: hypothetical protein JXA83_07095 [Acidimicrobiales bacterium]|nr:hypothetical protein [Acidimicrobiales bacterium]